VNTNPPFPFAVLCLIACCLSACASRGDRVEATAPAVVESEEYKGPAPAVVDPEQYRGPPTAAVTLVADRRGGRASGNPAISADLQHSIQQQLDRSGIFAGVVALAHLGEENEAEVIIEPILEALGGSGSPALRVRVTEKTKGTLVFDKRYEAGPSTDGLMLASRQLEEDLEARYGRRY